LADDRYSGQLRATGAVTAAHLDRTGNRRPSEQCLGRLVRRGRDLITATYAYIGPEVANRSKRFAGDNLACSNCHLQAGTKKFGIPLFGLFGEFPRAPGRKQPSRIVSTPA
jgi:thiosulfate dehydrogenase